MWTVIALLVTTMVLAGCIALFFAFDDLSSKVRSHGEAFGAHVRWDDDQHVGLDERISLVGKEIEKVRVVPRKKDTAGFPMVQATWEEVQATYANNPDNYKEQA